MESRNGYSLTEGTKLSNIKKTKESITFPICGPPKPTKDYSSILSELQDEVNKVSVALNFHGNKSFEISSLNAMKYLKENLEKIIEKYKNVN